MTKLNITKEQIEDLYCNKKLSIREIAKIYCVAFDTVRRKLKKFNIRPIFGHRKFLDKKGVKLTSLQKEVLMGSLFGDGHLVKRVNGSCNYSESHSIKQEFYAKWKINILSNILAKHSTYTDKRGVESINFRTITHEELKPLHELFYRGKVKIVNKEILNSLTPLGIAVWIMDDGSRSGRNIRISTDCFTYEEQLLFKNFFKAKYDIDVRVQKTTRTRNNKTYWYLVFNRTNSIKLTHLIKDFVLEEFKYKLTDFSKIKRLYPRHKLEIENWLAARG